VGQHNREIGRVSGTRMIDVDLKSTVSWTLMSCQCDSEYTRSFNERILALTCKIVCSGVSRNGANDDRQQSKLGSGKQLILVDSCMMVMYV
jgi:hypothetical protein